MKVDIFVTYASVEEDESYLTRIEQVISILKNSESKYIGINLNHRRLISAGSVISEEVSGFLEQSEIILLLFSFDFLHQATKQQFKNEFGKIIQKHKEKKAVVIPIILRSCPWNTSFFNILEPLPSKGKPIQKWKFIDEAYNNIYSGIEKVVNQIIEDKQNNLKEGKAKIIQLKKNKINDIDDNQFVDFLSTPFFWKLIKI